MPNVIKIILFSKYDSNIEISVWLDFILKMINEQLYKSTNKLENLDSSYISERMKTRNMRLSRLKHR